MNKNLAVLIVLFCFLLFHEIRLQVATEQGLAKSVLPTSLDLAPPLAVRNLEMYFKI